MKAKISELTAKGILFRILRRVKLSDIISQPIISYMVTDENRRDKLNKFYNELNFDEKGVFHSIFHSTFKGDKTNPLEGVWDVQFLDSNIKLPLKKESSYLDWMHAVTLLGHDVEVKQSYETLLKSNNRPAVFFDVGANYGTDSLLFLAQGVKTISFEPNPECKKKFDEFCQLNDFPGQMESTAVGENDGTVDFWLPENAPWLATIVEDTKKHLQDFKLEKFQVSLISLDSYTTKAGLFPDLIKIDTEGNEINVVKGATETIKKSKPIIIFECNYLSDKTELWNAFDALDYQLCALPLLPHKNSIALSLEEFKTVDGINFMAAAKKHSVFKEK